MNVEVNETESSSQDFEYTFMGISVNGLIVLFVNKGCGTVIKADEHNRKGKYYESWTMACFSKFKGKITITND